MCGSGHRRYRERRSNERHAIRKQPLDKQSTVTGAFCFVCNYSNQPDASFCLKCGSAITRCSISRRSFSTYDNFSQCPSCYNIFHEDHLFDWFTVNSICPICRKEISTVLTGVVGQQVPLNI